MHVDGNTCNKAVDKACNNHEIIYVKNKKKCLEARKNDRKGNQLNMKVYVELCLGGHEYYYHKGSSFLLFISGENFSSRREECAKYHFSLP